MRKRLIRISFHSNMTMTDAHINTQPNTHSHTHIEKERHICRAILFNWNDYYRIIHVISKYQIVFTHFRCNYIQIIPISNPSTNERKGSQQMVRIKFEVCRANSSDRLNSGLSDASDLIPMQLNLSHQCYLFVYCVRTILFSSNDELTISSIAVQIPFANIQ